MWFGPSLMMGVKNFQAVTTLYTTSQTVTPLAGALLADIECWGAGGYNGGGRYGGEGGSYAKKTVSLAGVSSLVLSIAGFATTGDGGSTSVTINGVVVCLANGGFANSPSHNTSPNIGDVTFRGGLGLDRNTAPWNTGQALAPGGGAGGPNGPGGDAFVNTDGETYGFWVPGASGGAPGGQGGAIYGGGGGGDAIDLDGRGKPGACRLTFRA